MGESAQAENSINPENTAPISFNIQSELALALSKAQGKFRTPKLNRTAKVFKNGALLYETHYADLEECIDCIKAPLSENELAFTQTMQLVNTEIFLVLTLHHSGGESLQSFMPINFDQPAQQVGGQLTYYKRYQISAFFGLAADFDDDANSTPGAKGDAAQFSDGKKGASKDPKPDPKPDPKQSPKPKNHAPGATQTDPADFVIPFGKETKGKKCIEVPEKTLVKAYEWANDQFKAGKKEYADSINAIGAFLASMGVKK